MTQEIINLYDSFTHGHLGRRDFINCLAVLAGSVAAANELLGLLENDYSKTAAFKSDIPLTTGYVTYPGASGEMKAFLAKPEYDGKFPAVIVIHENRGLNPYIEEVTQRLASAGFWALAPDALSPVGGTPADSEIARTKIGELNFDTTVQDFVAAVNFAEKHAETNGKVGCVGFCWGGRMSNLLAVHCPNLKAAVAYYGQQADAADVPKIKAAVMLHYASLDERVNAGIAAYEAALKAADINYVLHMYENVNHAFHNHTNAARYDQAAAELSWKRTMAFLSIHLF